MFPYWDEFRRFIFKSKARMGNEQLINIFLRAVDFGVNFVRNLAAQANLLMCCTW